MFSNSDPEALLSCSKPKQNIHLFEPVNKHLGSKLNLECVTQETPALPFILSFTFKTWTMPDLKHTQKSSCSKVTAPKNRRSTKQETLTWSREMALMKLTRKWHKKTSLRNAKDLKPPPWNSSDYPLYTWSIENLSLESGSLDKSAFSEFIFFVN